ncbi:hypothetical protein OG320_05130 [Microbispora sp. NBC_01189]|uniref:hypothetical protein n=1 Tax=Microbispora sp. NBC_01189 TaxID=2903583 RepID=UPI002E0F3696|nr:hypothetical protein OG320_05130 [Microbispora sp. NBC_01189]
MSLIGRQEPTHMSVPPYEATSGPEVVELAEMAGLFLDDWQQLILCHGLGERADGKWSAFEVAEILSRQNGKNAVFEARELGGLFLLGEELIIHTAHEFKTSAEAFRRVESCVSNTDQFRRRIARIDRTRGEEGIELRPTPTIITGAGGRSVRRSRTARLRFLARSKGSGRGFSGDCVILDEAYELGDDHMSALLPTLSARPNPQLWYGSSAGMKTSVQLGRIWHRGRRAVKSGVPDPSLAYFEWAAQLCTPKCPKDCTKHDDPADPEVWAKTNPGLGIRITVDYITREHATMARQGFARERLGVGDYPDEGTGWAVIPQSAWEPLADPASRPEGTVAFSADINPERTHGAIGVAGRRPDGLLHAGITVNADGVVDHRPGTGWMVARLVELNTKWSPCAVVIDPNSPAASLIPDLEAAGVTVVQPTTREYAQGCGQLYDAVVPPPEAEGWEAGLRHLGQQSVSAALAGAAKRDLGDGAWAWARKGLAVDISPLVAITLAAWGHATRARVETVEPFAFWD